MVATWRSVALLLAGALASVLGGMLVREASPLRWKIGLAIATAVLLLWGSGTTLELRRRWARYRRRATWLDRKIGILNDIEWDSKDVHTHSWTDVSPSEWKTELEKHARQRGAKIRVRLITTRSLLDSYGVILNPYGGAYPESDLRQQATLRRFLDYVARGGRFANVADVPTYWAYDSLLRKIVEAAPVTLLSPIGPVRTFGESPLPSHLWTRIAGTEGTAVQRWKLELEDEYTEIRDDIDEIDVARVVVCEKHVEPVVKPRDIDGTRVTPMCVVKYGAGSVFFSLPAISCGEPENQKLRRLIAKVLVKDLMKAQ